MLPSPPEYDDTIVEGANLAAQLIGATSEHNTSLGKVELTAEEGEDNND